MHQRILVHNRAARCVDQHAGGLHPREFLFPDQPARRLIERAVDREDVALGKQRIHVHEPVAVLFLLLGHADDVVVDHVRAERGHQRRHLLADAAQAQDAHGFAADHERAVKVLRARPVAPAQVAVDLQQVAVARQHQHDGQLRDNAGVDARAGGNRDAARAPGRKVHMVKPRAPALPEAHARRVVDDVRIDVQARDQVLAVRQIAVRLGAERVDQLKALRDVLMQRIVCAGKIDANQANLLHDYSPFR